MKKATNVEMKPRIKTLVEGAFQRHDNKENVRWISLLETAGRKSAYFLRKMPGTK